MKLDNNSHSLYERALEDIKIRRDRVMKGLINCIPWGLPRFEDKLPGIEQGKYYLITANSKVGRHICPYSW